MATNRWKVIEWESERRDHSSDDELSDTSEDDEPRVAHEDLEADDFDPSKPLRLLTQVRHRRNNLPPRPPRPRLTPKAAFEKTIQELWKLAPAALIPIFFLIWWCWQYCSLSTLDTRERPLDVSFMPAWRYISEEKMSDEFKRQIESTPLVQLHSLDPEGSLVLADGWFMDGSYVELVGYQWNATTVLGKMWDSMSFQMYKWVLDRTLAVFCVFEPSDLLTEPATTKAQVYPANERDWLGGGPDFRRYFIILCEMPAESKRLLSALPNRNVPTLAAAYREKTRSLAVKVVVQQTLPREVVDHEFPKLTIPLMPTRPYFLSFCTMIRDNSRFLPEWLEYHFTFLNFDHAYIYDHFSTDNITQVLQPYIDDGLVTLISAPLEMPELGTRWRVGRQALVQPTAFVSALNRYRWQTEWLAIFDVDEFLWMRQGNFMRTELERAEQDGFNSVSFDYYIFGPKVDEKDAQSPLVTQRYKYRGSTAHDNSKSIHLTKDVSAADIHMAKDNWHPMFPSLKMKRLPARDAKFVTYYCQYWMDQFCPPERYSNRLTGEIVYDNLMDPFAPRLTARLARYRDRLMKTASN